MLHLILFHTYTYEIVRQYFKYFKLITKTITQVFILANWVPKIFNKALSKENYDTEILQINNSCNVKSSFPPTRQTLKGCESQQGPMNTDIQPKLNEDDSIHKKQEGQEQRRFLRRGDGLARFRMSLEDFKSPPKIYKDKRIKTYLNKKSEILKGCQSKNFKTIKHSKVLANNGLPQIKKKTLSLPVNIYLPQNKTQKTCSAVKMELKQDTRQLDLEQIQNSNYGEKKKGTSKLFYPLLGEQKTGTGNCKKSLIVQENDCIAEPLNEEEIERKRDDRELKEFEILEQKVNESSFCSTSSLIDKLMEQSTVSHLKINEKNIKESVRNLKPMHCKYPVEDQIEKMEKLDYICHSKANNLPKIEGGKCEIQYKIDPLINEIEKERKIEMDEEKSWVSLCTDTDKSKHKNTNQKESELCHIQSEKKKVEQECKQNSKYLQSNFKESSDGITFNQTELFPKCVGKQQQRQINQHEIALKLQRKSLQDNVKQLLNWEYSPHKKSPKRIHKKLKPKIKKVEKSKSLNKEQSEKIILNNALLKERLDELQKEIIIFRRENSKVEKLQKECHEERIKLSKEKKEFERIMQEEKEKFEAKILESHKKLQKERNVFETYCKQKNNRFSRQEREELAELKKEIEKLTETAATKETRWGASQARLRNQIRNLEKENIRLKTENEKLKKLSFKRVTFGNDKNLDAKIIQVINAELEKLKPTIISPGFTCSCSTLSPQSATSTLNKSDTVKGKLLRRINSAPTMRKDLIADVNDEISCQREGKVLFSISTDSGIETSEIKNSSQIISENRNSTLNSSLVGCRCLEEASKSQLEDADQELCSRSLTRGEKQSGKTFEIYIYLFNLFYRNNSMRCFNDTNIPVVYARNLTHSL